MLQHNSANHWIEWISKLTQRHVWICKYIMRFFCFFYCVILLRELFIHPGPGCHCFHSSCSTVERSHKGSLCHKNSEVIVSQAFPLWDALWGQWDGGRGWRSCRKVTSADFSAVNANKSRVHAASDTTQKDPKARCNQTCNAGADLPSSVELIQTHTCYQRPLQQGFYCCKESCVRCVQRPENVFGHHKACDSNLISQVICGGKAGAGPGVNGFSQSARKKNTVRPPLPSLSNCSIRLSRVTSKLFHLIRMQCNILIFPITAPVKLFCRLASSSRDVARAGVSFEEHESHFVSYILKSRHVLTM